ncbi:hypothetical protein RB213_016200 [Colletotrichum asianum]
MPQYVPPDRHPLPTAKSNQKVAASRLHASPPLSLLYTPEHANLCDTNVWCCTRTLLGPEESAGSIHV